MQKIFSLCLFSGVFRFSLGWRGRPKQSLKGEEKSFQIIVSNYSLAIKQPYNNDVIGEKRNFPSAFSFFLIFHEFNEAEKQERQQRRLRKLAMELLSALKEEKYGQEEESISSKSLFSSSNSSMRADSVA
jgi:hypothetical protein